MSATPTRAVPPGATACLALADGGLFFGRGVGAVGQAQGELCFNTALSGYQEVLTDPSYAGQIVTFTFPHIGNVGANEDDLESVTPAARGLVLRAEITGPSNWRAARPFEEWLKSFGLVGIAGIDTRALTRRIRAAGGPGAVLVHALDGRFDLPSLQAQARDLPSLEGQDLALQVSCRQTYRWGEGAWDPATGGFSAAPAGRRRRVVAIDYGAKRNILRELTQAGCEVTVVPATATAEDVLRHEPEGVFLSNGPGDPAATGAYAVPTIQAVLAAGVPTFGICLGHQLLALAVGAKTGRLPQGHRGANHPVKDLATGRVEITSQNHGFVVLEETLPPQAEPTHVSLFDGTNEGIRLRDRPAFSVQYHPEASPGPHDSHYLFQRFVAMIDAQRDPTPGLEDLAPSVAPLVQAMRAQPARDDQPIPAQRAYFRALMERFAGPPHALADVQEFAIEGPGGPVPVRRYVPRDLAAPDSGAVLYLHGGGFTIGDLDTHDADCRRLADWAGAPVVAVNYRLAPEHPAPAAAEDGWAVLRAMADGRAGGPAPRRLVVAGDSAGGNLAVQMGLRARDAGGPALALLALIYPWTDLTDWESPSMVAFGAGYGATRAGLSRSASLYGAGSLPVTDPAVSPIFADLAGLPPVWLLTASHDPLRDQGRAFAEALRRAGVAVTALEEPGQIHGYMALSSLLPEAVARWRELAQAIRAALSG